jgi:hypothetical protein
MTASLAAGDAQLRSLRQWSRFRRSSPYLAPPFPFFGLPGSAVARTAGAPVTHSSNLFAQLCDDRGWFGGGAYR